MMQWRIIICLCVVGVSLSAGGDLESDAKAILAANWLGHSTKPAPRLYPHQWSWDSAFIAIGKSIYNQDQAQEELVSLFKGQWSNGMLPHIVFNPAEQGSYFPGPDWWASTTTSPYAPRYLNTSGIIDPPVHSIAALAIYNRATDKAKALDFLQTLFPKLDAWHNFIYNERQWKDGLAYLRHPWESGMDNSPLWDEAMENIDLKPGMVPPYNRSDNGIVNGTYRPSNWTYDRFVWLVELSKRVGYDEARTRSIKENNFLIVDVLFNALLVRANTELAAIAQLLGFNPQKYLDLAEMTKTGMNQHLWDQGIGTYRNYDMLLDRLTNQSLTLAAAMFIPLYARIPSIDQARAMYQLLNSKHFATIEEMTSSVWPIPSFSRLSPLFNPVQYWRGPVWINIDWLLFQGLKEYANDIPDMRTYANLTRNEMLKLVTKSGFWEYFNTYDETPYGTDMFSWTAALIIDLLHDQWN